MGIDPISLALTVMILWALAKRAPGYLGELVDAIRDGLDSQAYRDQLRRLRQAGISPSRAGALWRRMAGNAWREATNDLANRRRAATAALGQQASRWRRRLDDAAGQAADNIRARRRDRQAGSSGQAGGPVRATATVQRPVAPNPGPPTPGPVRATAVIPASARNPTTVTATVGRAAAPPAVALPAAPSAAALPGGGGTATAVLDGEVIDDPARPALPPAPAPRAIEGAGNSMAIEVTGVVSGAMEANAIAAAVEMANQAYNVALSAIRQRISNLIDATLNNVQMQGGGDVMTPLATASEAAATAQAAARNCGAEIGPLMATVAAEFNRRNS